MQREAWRQFLHGSVEPLSKTVSAEFSAKLDSDIRLDFHGLFASDLQGRARAYQSMTNGEKGQEPLRGAILEPTTQCRDNGLP